MKNRFFHDDFDFWGTIFGIPFVENPFKEPIRLLYEQSTWFLDMRFSRFSGFSGMHLPRPRAIQGELRDATCMGWP